MKKKYLALLLAVVLAVGLLPGTALAADYTYTEAIPCQYDEVKKFSKGLAAVKLDGKWGFIDKEGNVVVPLQYDDVNSFSEGLAAVAVITSTGRYGPNYAWGYIDQTGEEVIPCQYTQAYDFSEGLAVVGMANGRGMTLLYEVYCDYGYIDQTGQVVIPLQYSYARSFSEGLAGVTMDESRTENWGFIDKTGEVVVPCKYSYVQDFSEGLAVVRAADDPYLRGYVDKEGNEVIPCQYTEAGDFSHGLASVYVGEFPRGSKGFIDKSGNEVILHQYSDGWENAMYSFSEGLAAVQAPGQYYSYGYIDTAGNQVIPFQYLQAKDFSEGFALVQMGSTVSSGKWGYIDKAGNIVVPCQYDSAKILGLSSSRDVGNVSEGMAAVHIGDFNAGKWGFISISGTSEPKPTEPELPTKFTDVPAGAYYANAVNWAVENNVTSGKTSTTFEPNTPCSRAEIVTFLWRAYGSQEPTSTTNPFTDVSESAFYYKAVLWAVENGITSGTTSTTFSPSGTCTRDQAVTFQWRAAGRPAVSGGSSFTDVDSTAYYADAVAWAVANNITNGTSATTFNPSGICDRGQIVTFLYREMGQ